VVLRYLKNYGNYGKIWKLSWVKKKVYVLCLVFQRYYIYYCKLTSKMISLAKS
jgi:hypothetical protein